MSDVDVSLPNGKTLSLHFDGDAPPPDVLDKIVSQHMSEMGAGIGAPARPKAATPAPSGNVGGIGYRMRPPAAPAPQGNASAAFKAGTDFADPTDPWGNQGKPAPALPAPRQHGAAGTPINYAGIFGIGAPPATPSQPQGAPVAGSDADPDQISRLRIAAAPPTNPSLDTPKAKTARESAQQHLSAIDLSHQFAGGGGNGGSSANADMAGIRLGDPNAPENEAAGGHLRGAEDWTNFLVGSALLPLEGIGPAASGISATGLVRSLIGHELSEGALKELANPGILTAAKRAATAAMNGAAPELRAAALSNLGAAARRAALEHVAPAAVGGAVSAGASALQSSILSAVSPHLAKEINDLTGTVKQKAPFIAAALQAASMRPFMNPGAFTLESIPGRAVAGAINTGMTAGQNLATGQPTTGADILSSAATGAYFAGETPLGESVEHAGGAPVRALVKAAAKTAVQAAAERAPAAAATTSATPESAPKPPVATSPVVQSGHGATSEERNTPIDTSNGTNAGADQGNVSEPARAGNAVGGIPPDNARVAAITPQDSTSGRVGAGVSDRIPEGTAAGDGTAARAEAHGTGGSESPHENGTAAAGTAKTQSEPKPAYPNEANLARNGVDADAVERIKAEAKRQGLDTSAVIPHDETQQAARNLAVTADELRKTPLGQRRANTNETDWKVAVQQLVEDHASVARQADSEYRSAPVGPEKDAAFGRLLKANNDLTVAIAHDQRLAAESGRSLGARGKPTGGTAPVRGALAGSTADDILYSPSGARTGTTTPETTQSYTFSGPEPKTTAAPDSIINPPPVRKGGKGTPEGTVGTGRARRTPAGPASEKWGASNKVVSRDAYEAAQARFRQNATKLHAGLDPDLLKDAVIMGSFHIEAGLREFKPWSEQMRKELGDRASEGRLQTIWAGARHDLASRAQAAGAARPSSSVFADQMATKLGSREAANDFFTELNEKGGGASGTDLLDKILAAKGDVDKLTPAEKVIYSNAVDRNQTRKNAPPAPEGAMKILADIRAQQRAAERQATAQAAQQAKATAASTPAAKAPKAPPTAGELFNQSLVLRYGPKGAEAWKASVGPDLFQKLIEKQSPTEAEAASIIAAHKANLRPTPGARPNPGAESLTGVLGDAKKAADAAKRAQDEASKTDTDRFMDAAANTLGSKARADEWRKAIGEDLLAKHVEDKPLTPEEADKSGRALVQAKRPASTPKQVDQNVQELRGLLQQTKKTLERERVASLSPKELVREKLLSVLPTDENGVPLDQEKVKAITRDLADVDDHDTRRLMNVLSHHSANLLDNLIMLYKGGLLSGTSILGKIGMAHGLLGLSEQASTGAGALADRAFSKFLGTGERTVSMTGPGTTARALVQGVAKGASGAGTILREGENSLTLQGKNPFAEREENGAPKLRPEFSVQGKTGAVINPPARASSRVHGALYHIGNNVAYEGVKSEFVQTRAMNEANAQNLHGAARDSFMQKRMGELHANLPEEMVEPIMRRTHEVMLQNPNRMSEGVGRIFGENKNNPSWGGRLWHATGEVMAPFRKVGANISGKAAEYTGGPATMAYAAGRAAFSKFVGERVKGENGQTRVVKFADLPRDRHLELQEIWARTFGRGAVGMGQIAAGYALAHGVNVLGKQIIPANTVVPPDEQKHEYGSINAFGRKYGISGIQPNAAPLLAGASLEKEGLSAAGISKAIEPIVTENPYVRMLPQMEALHSIISPEPGDRNAAKAATRGVGSMIGTIAQPSTLVKEIAASTDPEHALRVKRGPLDYIFDRTPGLRETLPVMKDSQGRPIPEQGGPFHPLPNSPIQKPTETDHLFDLLDAQKKVLGDFWANPHPTAEDLAKAHAANALIHRLTGAKGPLHPIVGNAMVRHFIQGQQGQGQSQGVTSGR